MGNGSQPQLWSPQGANNTNAGNATGSSQFNNQQASNRGGTADPKKQAVGLMSGCREAMARGDFIRAEQLAQEAKQTGARFLPYEYGPEQALSEIARARSSQARGGNNMLPAGGSFTNNGYAQPAYSNSLPGQPGQGAMPVNYSTGEPSLGGMPVREGQVIIDTEAGRLVQAGETALAQDNPEQALQLFRQAYSMKEELDETTLQRLQDKLQLLSMRQANVNAEPSTMADQVAAARQVAVNRLATEVS